jgi:hypothetical protein
MEIINNYYLKVCKEFLPTNYYTSKLQLSIEYEKAWN